jgi:superfamily I DNA and RNA helicase
MASARFQNFESLNPNTAERRFWEALHDAFEKDQCLAYFRFPIYRPSGSVHRVPDVILLHRSHGLWIFEVKGCGISNVHAIAGAIWTMADWHSEEEQPTAQAEDGMYAIQSRLTERRETRGLLNFHYRVVLPMISSPQWTEKGFDVLPSTSGVIVLQNDLAPAKLRQKIEDGAREHPQRSLSDEQWSLACAALGGPLPSKEPREIPTGTSVQSPVRVIQYMESRLRSLDEQQLKIAYLVPEGPQRIRGLAGTGKTMLFAKRAALMHREHPEWRIAFVFFTRSLYEQILSIIKQFFVELSGDEKSEPDWQNLQVLHAWGAKERKGFYRTVAIRSGNQPMAKHDADRELGVRLSPSQGFRHICDKLEASVLKFPVLYDAIFIDEGQDLPPSFYRIAHHVLADPRRLYWAYDEAQGIGNLTVPRPKEVFGLRSDGFPVIDLGGNKLPDGSRSSPVYPGGARKAESMKACYRTPRQILMAAHAINMGLLREGGALQGVSNKDEWERIGYNIQSGDFSPASVKEGRTVTVTREPTSNPHPIDSTDFPLAEALGSPLTVKTFSSEAEERDWISSQIQEDLRLGFSPWDLLVTGPSGDKEENYFLALQALLKARRIPSVIAGVDTNADVFRREGHVTLSSIFRAKGNESWKVYACRFDYATRPLSWKDESELEKRNEAFVALTRTRLWCVVTGVESKSKVFHELRTVLEQSPHLSFKAFNQQSLKRVNDEELMPAFQ